MRVAYIINQYPKVTHSFIRREMIALERSGIEVERIALRGWDAELVDAEDIRERDRTRYVMREGASRLLLAVIRMLFARPVNLVNALALATRMGIRAERPLPVHFGYVAEACVIAFWLQESGVEFVHAHFGTNAAEVAMLVHVLGGPKWSFTAHGPEEFVKAELIGLREKVRRSAFVVAISSYARSQVCRFADAPLWPKIHIVRCGIDRAFYDVPKVTIQNARRFVCVGRLCENKGQVLLVEAARRLAPEYPDLEVVLAGDGELRTEIEALIAKHGLESHVRITGWVSGAQVREEIVASQAMVLPSFSEGLPVVIMEAMALRRPIISTYVAAIPELVIPGEHGWLVQPGDVDALVNAMRDCLNTPVGKLDRMGENGRERVLAQHDVDAEAAKLGAILQAERGDQQNRNRP